MTERTLEVDTSQIPWETPLTSVFETAIWAVSMGALYHFGMAPFEYIAILMLAVISANTAALWRVVVR